MASHGRPEQIDERLARMARQQRANNIREANSGVGPPQLQAVLSFEDWYSGDTGEHPEPGELWQPAFEEPFVNDFGSGVWADNDDDRYWLRIPSPGYYRVSIDLSWFISLNLGGPGGYHGIELMSYAEQMRSLPPGEDPVGRVDPYGFTGSYSSSFGPTQDTRYLPQGRTDFNIGYSYSGVPLECIAEDSIRVIARAIEVDTFGAGDEFFSISAQGQILVERIGDLPA